MSENKLRVLVVDDEQSIRRFLRVTLAAQDYAVFEATTGQEALSGAVSFKPDIIILDLGLPTSTASMSRACSASRDRYPSSYSPSAARRATRSRPSMPAPTII